MRLTPEERAACEAFARRVRRRIDRRRHARMFLAWLLVLAAFALLMSSLTP